MSVSSHTGLFGSRAAVAKLRLPPHCGCVQMTGHAFIWVSVRDLSMRETKLYLFELSLLPFKADSQ